MGTIKQINIKNQYILKQLINQLILKIISLTMILLNLKILIQAY